MSLVLSGCGMGVTSSGVTSAVQTSGISGKVHGGPNPVTNANVLLWETWTTGVSNTGTGRTAATNSGYGTQAYQIGSTTSNAQGLWSIPSFNCDNGEYLYVTITGGTTASNSANKNEVLVTAIGPCSTLPAAVHIDVSEVSTVAAAFALGPFMKVNPATTGSGTQQVWIGSPAANNAAAGGCTGTGSTLACTATGLGQAFENAMSLVSAVSYSGSPVGTANTVPTDYTGTAINTAGSVPQALLNTLGNVLETCVNSSGGTAGDPSACGKLFYAAESSALIPTDTLQAAMNIASNPANNVPAIYALAAPVTSFTPALTAQPNDFSVAITYNGSSSLTQFDPPHYVVLQPNETVTVLTQNTADTVETLINVSTTGEVNNTYAQYSGLGQGILAVDLTGRLFAASPKNRLVNQYDSSTLSRTHQYTVTIPTGLAVDRNSNVYWTQLGSGSSVYSLAPASTTPAQTTFMSVPGYDLTTSNTSPGSLAFDASQNLWMSMLGVNNPQVNYVYEKNIPPFTCTPPDFCGFNGYQATSGTGSSYGTVFNSTGTAYTVFNGSVYALTNNPVGNETLVNTYPLSAGDIFGFPSMDGVGVAFFPNHTAGGVYAFNTNSNTTAVLKPCSLRIANSTAQTTSCSNALTGPLNTQVDAAGAVWAADATSGVVAKILGVGSPAWPALALSQHGVEPQ